MLKDRYINPFPDIAKVNLSLKYYQDIINVTNTDFRDGERKEEKKD